MQLNKIMNKLFKYFFYIMFHITMKYIDEKPELKPTNTGLVNNIQELYKQTISYDIKKAGCKGIIQYNTGVNNWYRRFKKLKNEDYYIVKCDFWEKISTFLNIILFVTMFMVFIHTINNDYSMVHVNKDGNTVGVEKFNNFMYYFNWVKNGITVYVLILQGMNIYYRTTSMCNSGQPKTFMEWLKGNKGNKLTKGVVPIPNNSGSQEEAEGPTQEDIRSVEPLEEDRWAKSR